jgi:hypothetical protein
MKCRILTCITAMTLWTALALPVGVVAQDNQHPACSTSFDTYAIAPSPRLLKFCANQALARSGVRPPRSCQMAVE